MIIDYYPFGLTMPGRSSNSANPNDNYKFTGHERDDEAGLTLDYMMARNYDPIIGRFLQIDPLAASFPDYSPYNYTLNNPINMWDPDGRAPTGCCLISQMFGGVGAIVDVVLAANGDRKAQQNVKNRAAIAGVATVVSAGAVYAPSALLWASQNPVAVTTGGATVASALDPNPGADYLPGPIDNTGNAIGQAVRSFGDDGASGISRALTAGDFGLADDAFKELSGTFSVTDDIATVSVDMIEGNLGNGFKALKSLMNTASEAGASTLKIEGRLANENLQNVLQRLGELVTNSDNIDVIKINLRN